MPRREETVSVVEQQTTQRVEFDTEANIIASLSDDTIRKMAAASPFPELVSGLMTDVRTSLKAEPTRGHAQWSFTWGPAEK